MIITEAPRSIVDSARATVEVLRKSCTVNEVLEQV